MHITLLVNGKINPIGIDKREIRLSFKTCLNFQRATFQVFENEEKIKEKQPIFNQTVAENFTYFDAKEWNDGQSLLFRVELENIDEIYRSEIACFELGISRNKNEEKWIDNPLFDGRVAEFKRTFSLKERPTKARLYIVGLGMYESYVNGRKTDEFYFKPLLTDFDHRIGIDNQDYDEQNFYNNKKTISYDCFDILDLLNEGENTLSVLLGTGWYCNDDKLITDPCDRFGLPKLFFELHLEYGGEKEILYSDENCKVRNTNRISQLFVGDFFDFTKSEEDFIDVRVCRTPTGRLVERKCEHDGVVEKVKPVKSSFKDNVWEYDFGKNHSGSIYLSVKGKKGSKLVVRYFEVKDENGLNAQTSEWIGYDVSGQKPVPVVWVRQKDEYVLSGNIDKIQPLFHWNCYRYATIECSEPFEIIDVESYFICTQIAVNGDFKCSDEFINTFYRAFVLTQRDNMHCGVPSDCPHREKLPYTGDGNLVAESALYVLDAENFYRKWLKDVLDAQGNNGWMPYTAPYIGGAGGYWWSKIITALPLTIYHFTGDKKVLQDSIESVFKYLDFCSDIHKGKYIINKTSVRWLLGEWLNPEQTEADVSFMNTLAYYGSVADGIRMCEILQDDRIEKLKILQNHIANAINEKFFNDQNLTYCKGVQGENLLPILFGIAKEEIAETLWKKVVDNYKEKLNFDTGIVLTPMLLNALTERGEEELAYKLFTAEGKPSFKYMLNNETTLCEHWNKFFPALVTEEKGTVLEGGEHVSHCHPMFGSVVSWMFRHIAGLDLSHLYEKTIIFRPRFTKIIKNAGAYKETDFGTAFVRYETENGFKMNIIIPNGLKGKVILPRKLTDKISCEGKEWTDFEKNYGEITLESGSYQIK